MKITITIDTSNAAFEDNGFHAEIGSVLRALAERINPRGVEAAIVDLRAGVPVRDSNGNSIGEMRITGR